MLKFLKSFFYSNGKPQPVYFWITVFCSMAVSMVAMRLFSAGDFSDTLILGVLGFIVTWVGLYNFGWRKKADDNEKKD